MGGATPLQRAAVLAMRDAAALILLQLDQATKISRLADGPIDVSAIGPPSLADAGNEAQQLKNTSIFAIGGIDDD